MSDFGVDRSKHLIARGLERYQRGELRDALAQWELALEATPSSEEARALVEFGRALLVSGRAGAPPPPPVGARGERRRRTTQSSPIPRLLAPLTSPQWSPDDGPALLIALAREAAVPSLVVREEETRPLAEAADERPDVAHRRERLRREVQTLLERCRIELETGRAGAAAAAADQVLAAADEALPPGVDDLVGPARGLLEAAFQSHVGRQDSVFAPIFHIEQVGAQRLDARAGFLLSRIEGPTALEQIADASGMPRLDVLRGVSALLREGALKRV